MHNNIPVVPDSSPCLYVEGTTYFGFPVNHAGIAHLGATGGGP